jgi:DNA-binding beta-propeller fold protein YncE
VATGGATVSTPSGIALDPAAGRVYWLNGGPSPGVSYANLDGSGGGDLNTAGATMTSPNGLGIDRAAGRVYWGNGPPDERISYANLDGSGGADLVTTGAVVESPSGVAVDPPSGRIYWSNFELNAVPVSYGHLNGASGGNVNPPGSGNATSVALDPATGRVYWGNLEGKIEFSMPDGSGDGELNLAGATVSFLRSIAIDPVSNRVYWVNEQPLSGISFASLDGSGGSNLAITGAPIAHPYAIALLRSPSGTGAPTIGGRAVIRSPLTCSGGSWAADLPGALLYRAPRSVAIQWLRAGRPIAGATSASYRPSNPGSYSCQATATNHAGSATLTSAAVPVRAGIASAARVVEVRKGVALLKLRCGGIPCGGVARLKRGNGPLGKARFAIAARKRKTVRMRLRRRGRRLLAAAARDRLRVKLAGTGLRKRSLVLKPAGR